MIQSTIGMAYSSKTYKNDDKTDDIIFEYNVSKNHRKNSINNLIEKFSNNLNNSIIYNNYTFDFIEYLQACHIIPKHITNSDNSLTNDEKHNIKINRENCIFLTETHHGLFDDYIFTFDPEKGNVIYNIEHEKFLITENIINLSVKKYLDVFSPNFKMFLKKRYEIFINNNDPNKLIYK
jgi:hypothetical protein